MSLLLPPTIITTAATAVGAPCQLRMPAGGLSSNFMSAQLTFTYGSGGTNVNVYVQTSFDAGTTWCDVISFTQLATASARYIASAFALANLTSSTPTDGTLGAATNLGLFGPWWRVKYISTGTYAGNTTLRVDGFSNCNFNAAGVGSFN